MDRRFEVKVAGKLGIGLIRRSPPIVTELSYVEWQWPITPTCGGEKDGVAVNLTGHTVSAVPLLWYPCPNAFIHKLLTLPFGRQAPGASPTCTGSIKCRVAFYITCPYPIGFAVGCCIWRLSHWLSPSKVIAIILRLFSTNIACCPFYAQSKVNPFMSIYSSCHRFRSNVQG